MALGSIQPLTEMSTMNLPGGKGRPVHKADNLTAICEMTVGASTSHRLVGTVTGIALHVTQICLPAAFTLIFCSI
jgi:hypothetical protein